MTLLIATGSNLNDRQKNLVAAKNSLSNHFELLEESRIYTSSAVDFEDQPDFYNQVLAFKSPKLDPKDLMSFILKLEAKLGRQRGIPKGPRIIDIDILFYDDFHSTTDHLTLPHPRLFERSFVVLPLMELKCFDELKVKYDFSESFENSASPLNIR